MPRLSKIRLTGCKYEKMKKQHENSIFDLTRNENPDHSLFTLYNGGGKGVMMQLIFQLLLPETRWGKNDGNKVISMFYDGRNNLNSYTLHVALEWALDTTSEKRLITGIAIKPIIKNTSLDEEEKTGLSYFLYTYEHDSNGYFNIENLPIYNTNTGEGVDLEEFEKFLDDNKRDFIKYSQSSVKRNDCEYYRYLETKGIYKSEWTTLKTINKSEGGVGDFFTKSSNNKSIFDNVIIPAISENIKNYTQGDGDSLIKMFKSNLSITKDLPILIKREGSYKELLINIKPLIENADSGSRFLDQRARIINEGNDIYHILRNQENIVEEDIEKWKTANGKAKIEKKELSFKKDNLYYNKEKMELNHSEEMALNLQKKLEEKTMEFEEKQEELIFYEVNKILCEKRKTEDNINNKIVEKERLIKTLDLEDIKEKIEELELELEEEWNKAKYNIINTESEYRGYINYLKQIMTENKSKKKIYEINKNELERSINIFKIKEENLAKDKSKLGGNYDFMTLGFPERIVDDLNKDRENLKESIEKLLNKVKSLEEKSGNLNDNINKLSYELKDKEKDFKSLKLDIDKQEKYEFDLAIRITKQLLEEYEANILDHTWFHHKLQQIESMEKEKYKSLEGVQRAIWEKNLDKFLNREDYFIPNKDIILIKEEIERINIHVETGTEYFMALEEKERLDLIKTYPGFLYSLVIGNKKEWDLIERNISKDLFLNNMVPIYIRSEMKSITSMNFITLEGKSIELVNSNNYTIWKGNIEKEFQSLSKTEKKIKLDLQNISIIKQDINLISKNDTSYILNQKIKELQGNISNLTEEIRKNKEEKLNIENSIILNKSKIDENQKSLVNVLALIKEMEIYIKNIEEIEKQRVEIEKVQKDLKDINEKISNIDDDSEDIIEKQYNINNRFNKWKIDIDNIIKDVKIAFKDAKVEYREDPKYTSFNLPDFNFSVDKLKSLVEERKVLEENIVGKNISIAVLDEKISGLNMLLRKHIKDLEDKTINWESYEDLLLPIDEVVMIIGEIKKNIKSLNLEKQILKTQHDELNGKISGMKRNLDNRETQILKDHKRPYIILEINDIDSAIDLVDRDIKSNEDYLILCEDMIKDKENIKNKLQLNLTRIKSNYELDSNKGKMDKILKSKIEDNSDIIVEEWLSRCAKNKIELDKTVEEGQVLKGRFIKTVSSNLDEEILREKIIEALKEANIENFKNNRDSFESMEIHFEKELLSFSKDKEKAEGAKRQWSARASMHVIRIIESLKNMVSNMNYANEQGHIFPLVKLKGDERLPKEESDIRYLLDEYFIEAISKVLELNENIDNIDDKILNNLMGDKVIFSRALQGRYPTLIVYKMSEKNEFKYAKPRDEYYTTWEAINKGEGDLPEGSGGQTLSVNTFVIMMIMNFKKKHMGNENPWTVLILDNPFGKASAKHVLDPIFEIANKLNFQLIAFAAPEIIKVEISERFPVFWELRVEDGKVVHGGRVIK